MSRAVAPPSPPVPTSTMQLTLSGDDASWAAARLVEDPHDRLVPVRLVVGERVVFSGELSEVAAVQNGSLVAPLDGKKLTLCAADYGRTARA